jgi:hypothetical protein
MIQDYGAPIGFRLATAHPERMAIINQNGVYEGRFRQRNGKVLEHFGQTKQTNGRCYITCFFSSKD